VNKIAVQIASLADLSAELSDISIVGFLNCATPSLAALEELRSLVQSLSSVG
jgi:hypothetical protein